MAVQLTPEQRKRIREAETFAERVIIANEIANAQDVPPPRHKDDDKELGDDFGGR